VIDAAFIDLAELTSTKRACVVLGKSRATHYRRQPSAPAGAAQPAHHGRTRCGPGHPEP
jgi:hypothetical protein